MHSLSATRLAAEDIQAVQDLYYRRGWTDGLPIVPPTPELVEATLSFTSRSPDEIIGQVPERRRSLTVEKVAINAVMAGCRPEYLPVVVAVVEAMCDPAAGLHGATASTAGAGLLAIVNGPPVGLLKINTGGNLFGPGVRANATIGRALRLIIMNCAGADPGGADRSTLGHGGKFSWCIGEDTGEPRWTPLHAERGLAPDQGAVTTFWGMSTTQVSEHSSSDPEAIVSAIARAMGVGGSPIEGDREVVVVIAGEHQRSIADAGWNKQDVRECLFRHAPGPPVAAPEDFLVVAAGGSGGRFSAFSLSWGVRSSHAAVTKPVEACVACD